MKSGKIVAETWPHDRYNARSVKKREAILKKRCRKGDCRRKEEVQKRGGKKSDPERVVLFKWK